MREEYSLGVIQKSPSVKSIDEIAYEKRPKAPPQRKASSSDGLFIFSNNGDSHSNNHNHNHNHCINNNIINTMNATCHPNMSNSGEERKPMTLSRKRSPEVAPSKSLKQKPNLKSSYSLHEQDDHEATAAYHEVSTPLTDNTRRLPVEQFADDTRCLGVDVDVVDREGQREHRPENCRKNSKTPKHPESVYVCRRRMLGLFSFVAVGGGLTAAVVLGSLNQDDQILDPNAACNLCYQGSNPSTSILTDFCVDLEGDLDMRTVTDPLCSSGQSLAWLHCGCTSLPPLPQDSDADCSLCPSGEPPATRTQECQNFDAFVSNVGRQDSQFVCGSVRAMATAECVCSLDDSVRTTQFRKLLQPIVGSQLLDDLSPQGLSLEWLAVDSANEGIDPITTSFQDILERYSLAVFFHSLLLSGDWMEVLGFDVFQHACFWGQGIQCNSQKVVTHLDFGECSLSPSQVFQSDGALNCRSHDFNGTIAREVGFLSSLHTLNLGGNRLTSSIPDSIPPLRSFNLEGNSRMTGTIPSNLFEESLEDLDLSGCGFTGTLPSHSLNGGSLYSVQLKGNRLSGTFPSRISNSIRKLDLSFNEFSGSLPELSVSSNIEDFRVCGNRLTGSVPHTLVTQQRQLQKLHLCENSFEGIIPAFPSKSEVTELKLSNNKFIGPLNSVMLNLSPTTLNIFEVTGNKFTGTLPATIGSLTNMHTLKVDEMQLIGELPTEFGQMTALTQLEISGNLVQGRIPTQFGNLSALRILRFERNQITGTVPTEMGFMTSLIEIKAAQNRLEGTLPAQMSFLSNLENVELWMNDLSGDHAALASYNPALVQVATFGNEFDSVEEMCDREPTPKAMIANYCENTNPLDCSCCTHCCFRNVTCVPLTAL